MTRAAVLSALLVLAATAAQGQGPPGTHMENGGLNGSLSRSDLEKLNGDHPQNPNGDDSKDTAEARAKAKEQSMKLVAALNLACNVSRAHLVVAGTTPAKSGGKEVETRVYEVVCGGAMGYLLEAQGSQPPLGISCLSAEETRSADVARGKEPGFYCTLAENKDVNGAVAAMIASGAGATCTVRELKAFGRSQSTQAEYSEVACGDGKGFLLRTPLPGSQAKTTVTSCADAAKQGIKCRMTDAGPVEEPVTLQTFKTALAQHGVACDIAQVRLIGQEDHLKRYVVEYRCADQAHGQVAFLPLEGNTNPYETSDCKTAAAERAITCTLSP
jgi:hypothetical protein